MTEPFNEWLEEVTHGQGSFGYRCVLCCGIDYGSPHVKHKDDCLAMRFPTRRALKDGIARLDELEQREWERRQDAIEEGWAE